MLSNGDDGRQSSELEEHEQEHEQELQDSDNGRGRASRQSRGRGDGNSASRQGSRLGKVVSTTSSVVPPVVKVPRSQRTGLLANMSILYEAQEPKHYPRWIKWCIVAIIAAAAATAPMGSSIILHDFGTTDFITNLSVALYMLSMSVFPLWWSAMSETVGRRTVYLTAFTLYAVFNIASAVSSSISMFIVFRFFAGGTSASVQAVGAGTVADIWEVKERGRAMGIFYLGPLAGPLLAPIIGGALAQSLGWRSTQWFQAILGGVVLLAILLFLPETHKQAAVAREQDLPADAEIVVSPNPSDLEKAEMAEKPASRPHSRPPLARVSSQRLAAGPRSLARVVRKYFIEPLAIIGYLRFPPVALTVAYASVSFCCLYFLNISVEQTFSAAPYNFSEILVGCLYLSNSLGYFVASLLGGPWIDRIMAREARAANRIDERGKLVYRPEDRLRENAWLGGFLMPAALLWYGWSVDAGVFWFCPVLAMFFFGVGSMLIFGAATTMLTEFMPSRSSSGVALNNFVRNIFAFVGTLAANPAIGSIGNGWLFTILGIVCGLSASIIWVMRRYGEKWRAQIDRELK